MNIARKETRGIEGLALCLLLCAMLFTPGAVTADTVSFTALPSSLGALGKLSVPVFALLCGYYCHNAARGVDDFSAFSLKAVFGLYKCYWAVLLVFLPLIVYANRQLRSLLLYELIYNFLGLNCSFNGECWPLLSFALFFSIYPAVKRLLDNPGVFAGQIAQLLVLFALNAFIFAALPRIMTLSLFSTLSQTIFYSRLDEFFSLLPSFWLGCVFAQGDVLARARRLAENAFCCIAALALLAAAFIIYSALGTACAFLSAGVLVFALSLLGAAKPLRVLSRLFELLGAETTFAFFILSFLCHTLPHRLIMWPRYTVFVFLWLLTLSFFTAKLLRLFCRYLDKTLIAYRARRTECAAPAVYTAEFTKLDTSVMKGVAVSLMIAHHLFTFPERLVDVGYISVPFINGMTLAACLGQFGKICVSVFTLLSGYGTYLSLSRAQNDAAVTLRHIRSLYISYWKVFLIAVPISLFLSRSFGEGTAINVIYSFLGIRLAYCSEWWFIIPFAVLIILAPYTKRFIDRPSSSFASRFLWILAANAALYYVLNPLMKTPLMSKLYESVFWAFFSSALTLCRRMPWAVFSRASTCSPSSKLIAAKPRPF